jgi:hypothetical protein
VSRENSEQRNGVTQDMSSACSLYPESSRVTDGDDPPVSQAGSRAGRRRKNDAASSPARSGPAHPRGRCRSDGQSVGIKRIRAYTAFFSCLLIYFYRVSEKYKILILHKKIYEYYFLAIFITILI